MAIERRIRLQKVTSGYGRIKEDKSGYGRLILFCRQITAVRTLYTLSFNRSISFFKFYHRCPRNFSFKHPLPFSLRHAAPFPPSLPGRKGYFPFFIQLELVLQDIIPEELLHTIIVHHAHNVE